MNTTKHTDKITGYYTAYILLNVIQLNILLYTLYIRPLSHILEHHRVLYHTYADDTQLYVKFDRESPSSMQIAINRLEDCLLDVSRWMAHNGLKLNNLSQLEQKLLNRAPQFETLEFD